MTAPFDFDRRLTDWLEEVGEPSTPDYFDELLDRTRRTRQRHAWASLERWLPVQLSIVRRPLLAVPRVAWGLVVLLLVLAIGLLASSYLGRQRLPAPFGPARTGLVTFDAGGDIYVANPDGTGERALTTGSRADIAPTFSLDGTRIAFWSANDCHFSNVPTPADCHGPYAVQVIAADGSHLTTIATAPDLNDPTMSWAPDGRRLVYVEKASEGSHLGVADLDRGTTSPITDPAIDATHPQWAPTGDLIAFSSALDAVHRAVFVVPAAGGPARLVGAPYGDLDSPVWSPDGRHIATFTSDGASNHDIVVFGLDTSEPTKLTRTDDDEFFPVWSNDGTRIAYSEIDSGKSPDHPQVNAWVMNADGSGRRKLFATDITGTPMMWSPDDKDLLAYSGDGLHVAVISVDDSHPQRSVAAPGDIYAAGSFQRLAP